MTITDNQAKVAIIKRLAEDDLISFEEMITLLSEGVQSIPYVYPINHWWTPTHSPYELTCKENTTNTLKVAHLAPNT